MTTFETMEDFRSLARSRRTLQDYCERHVESILHFSRDWRQKTNTGKDLHQSTQKSSGNKLKYGFIEWETEKLEGEKTNNKRDLRHITTTATCLESLLNCPERFWPENVGKQAFERWSEDFASEAIGWDHSQWTSYNSASIYCRCHALPHVIDFLKSTSNPAQLDAYHGKICEHITRIFLQMEWYPTRGAIGEEKLNHQTTVEGMMKQWQPAWKRKIFERDSEDHCTIAKMIEGKRLTLDNPKEDFWNPPNAFHTYWALCVLDRYKKFCSRHKILDNKKYDDEFIINWEERIKHWTREQLAVQIALHHANSDSLDSDQLGWCLALYTRFYEDIWTQAIERELIKQGLECLFKTQLPVGIWRSYKPIFQYRDAGDAYCYVFETFAELLGNSLKKEGRYLRVILCDYREQLEKLANYAYERGKRLGDGKRALGWCSGHHLHRTEDAEGWATADVFLFFHRLRRLFAEWTKEAAFANLRRASRPSSSREDAIEELVDRGETWIIGGNITGLNIGEQLLSLFVYPSSLEERPDLPIVEQERWKDDPDTLVVRKDQPRSAILFGPPGTSKTTVVRAVAKALGWGLIEIHVSDFVGRGYNEIGQTADNIFALLMQLDRCIVFFDEIDELVRSRTTTSREQPTEAFSRFLTTSMLPKIAELYEQRRIIYFVATNHLEYFDEAIKRSKRFDALLFFAPPSFEKKKTRLLDLFVRKFGHSENSVRWGDKLNQELLEERADPQQKEEEEEKRLILQRFMALRYDQLDELTFHLQEAFARNFRENSSEFVIDEELLRTALNPESMKNDYDEDVENDQRNDQNSSPLAKFRKWDGQQRVDQQLERAWRIFAPDEETQNLIAQVEEDFKGKVFEVGGRQFFLTGTDLKVPLQVKGYTIERDYERPGWVRIQKTI